MSIAPPAPRAVRGRAPSARQLRTRLSPALAGGTPLRFGDVVLHPTPVETLYPQWPAPVVIMSDGAYGVSGFPGDPATAAGLSEWYAPHIAAWSARATPETTLWFWNTEQGWATVHPMLLAHGWEFRGCNIWDKGIAHIAGRTNSKTLRRFPPVTEVCAHYTRPVRFDLNGTQFSMQDWLRQEWRRSGLPFSRANEACGVRNAATRKYLTGDHHFYAPPAEVFERMAAYVNAHGDPAGRPYFVMEGEVISARKWARLQAKFYCPPSGVTNVWQTPTVRGAERLKINGDKALHLNQKPLALIERIVLASSDPGDVVWEPFGGLCPTAVVAARHSRAAHSAEVVPEFFTAAADRLSAMRRGAWEAPGTDSALEMADAIIPSAR